MNGTDQRSTRDVFRAWLAVGVWLAIIVFESTNLLSSGRTGSVLYFIVTSLFGHIDSHKFAIFHAVLRKIGHFVGYGILALLIWRAERITWANRHEEDSRAVAAGANHQSGVSAVANFSSRRVGPWSAARWATWAVICTAIVASLDEWHQTFLPTRTGAFHDVVLDIFGGAVAVLIATVLVRHSRR